MVIKERLDGRLEGRVTVNGIRKSFYGSSKAEIKQKAKEYLTKVENGYKEPKKIIFNDYMEYWLKTYKLNKIEPSSYTRLYSVYECQLKDTLGRKKIGEITTADIQNLIDIRANPIDSSERPLALSGLKRIIHFLRPCFCTAVNEGIIYRNPCDNVILPVESCITVETKEQHTMNDQEIQKFKESALSIYKTTNDYKSRDGIVLLVILNLGLRVGEMLALEWTDIDFEKRIIHISKTIQSNIKNFSGTGNSTYSRIKNGAKTKTGKRVISMNDTIIWYLEELKEYDKRHDIQSKYVCCTNKGTIQNSRNLQRSLDRIISRTDISIRVSLHTLRHTFGSTLLRRGVSIEVVSKLMGHSNITITYLKYIHVIKEQEAIAMGLTNVC